MQECAIYVGLVRAAQEFTSQFPVTTFFINEQIIDGKLVIPAMDLAGYVRAFTEPKAVPPFDSWPYLTQQCQWPCRF